VRRFGISLFVSTTVLLAVAWLGTRTGSNVAGAALILIACLGVIAGVLWMYGEREPKRFAVALFASSLLAAVIVGLIGAAAVSLLPLAYTLLDSAGSWAGALDAVVQYLVVALALIVSAFAGIRLQRVLSRAAQ